MIVMIPATAILAALLLLLLPFLAVYWVVHKLRGIHLDRAYRQQFASKGKPAIIVYSESPNWQEYFERHVLPDVSDRAVVLNWSERRKWRWNRTLPIKVYQHHRPSREFNPYALVFRPDGAPRHVPFFAAFKDFKHGKPEVLDRAVAELTAEVARASTAWTELEQLKVGAA